MPYHRGAKTAPTLKVPGTISVILQRRETPHGAAAPFQPRNSVAVVPPIMPTSAPGSASSVTVCPMLKEAGLQKTVPTCPEKQFTPAGLLVTEPEPLTSAPVMLLIS